MTVNRASQLAVIGGVILTCLFAGWGAATSAGRLAQRVTVLENKQDAAQHDHDLLIKIDADLAQVMAKLGIME